MNLKIPAIVAPILGGVGMAVALSLSPDAAPAIVAQLADGGIGCVGACFDAGAPIFFTVHDSPAGRHASVAQQCPGTNPGHSCDFFDDLGVRHIVQETGVGLTIVQGGTYNAVVQAPDGGFVAQ